MLHGARKNDRQIVARYVKINFLRTIFEMALVPFHFEIFNSLKFNEIMDVGKKSSMGIDSELVSIRMNT
jgi:hypothetical protein